MEEFLNLLYETIFWGEKSYEKEGCGIRNVRKCFYFR